MSISEAESILSQWPALVGGTPAGCEGAVEQLDEADEAGLRMELRPYGSSAFGLDRPQYRLRVDEVRVFYDVTETAVEVLAIVSKAKAQQWLDQKGTPRSSGGPGEGEG